MTNRDWLQWYNRKRNYSRKKQTKEGPENTNDSTMLFMGLALSAQKQIYAFILSLVVSPSDADDILQETLTVMWRKFGEFESGTNFVAWGRQIARFKVMDYLRKNRTSKFCFDSDVLKLIESKSSQIDNLSDRNEAMQKCLQKLPEKQRSMLNMRYSRDMSFKQIALEYGVSKQSIYRMVSRIHALLAKCIKSTLVMRGEYGI